MVATVAVSLGFRVRSQKSHKGFDKSSAKVMRRADSLEKTLMLGKIEGGGEGDNRA